MQWKSPGPSGLRAPRHAAKARGNEWWCVTWKTATLMKTVCRVRSVSGRCKMLTLKNVIYRTVLVRKYTHSLTLPLPSSYPTLPLYPPPSHKVESCWQRLLKRKRCVAFCCRRNYTKQDLIQLVSEWHGAQKWRDNSRVLFTFSVNRLPSRFTRGVPQVPFLLNGTEVAFL